MHPLLRFPYAALGAAAEIASVISPEIIGPSAPKWRRALSARRGLSGRLRTFAETRDTSRPLVWFHAPSAGEALQAFPVHERIRAQRDLQGAGIQTALTFFSPSAEYVAQKFGADFCDYLAFDTARGADTALGALRPAALVYSKLDVWPVLTARAKARDIPVGMISATMRPGSSRQGSLATALLRDAYASLDLVGAISGVDAQRLAELGVRHDRIRVTGDTRYDQVWERALRVDPDGALLAPLASSRPTLVAGSTWEGDVDRLFDAWPLVRKKFPDARVVIAPHEPNDAQIARIESHAMARKLTVSRLSEGPPGDADVVVINRVGVLGEIYALGWAALVGGGFHQAGLHSVLEPAALGVPVIAGAIADENEDIARLTTAGAGRRVVTGAELADAAIAMFDDHGSGRKMGRAAVGVVEANLGAADRAAELVRALWSREVNVQH